MEKPGQEERYWIAAGCLLALAWAAHFLWLTQDRDSFTWMDPYQYFGFARSVLTGARPWNSFEVASIFPYFLLPTLWLGGGSIAAGLATHVWVTLALLGVFAWLGRAMEARGAWWLLGCLWLGTPLAFGLSHELYCETTLTLLVAGGLTATWVAWRRGTWPFAILAGLLWGLSIMVKITAPVFYAGPFLVLACLTLAAGWRSRQAIGFIRLSLSYLIGLAVVVILEMTLFYDSWDYWRSLGNTTIPVMDLIGPRHFSKLRNFTYYGWVILTFGLSLGAVAVGAVGIASRLRRRPDRPSGLGMAPVAFLAAWVLLPVVVFTIQPVKEPRHILPALPPLFLLIAMSVQGLEGRGRDLLRGGCLALTLLGYGLLLCAGRNPAGGTVPYFTRGATRALETADVVSKELAPSIIGVTNGAKVPSQDLWVRFNLDIAVSGLPPDEAMAMTWALRPAIVYDLDRLPKMVPGLKGLWRDERSNLPMTRFEDLFVYSSFNVYNARCGLPFRYEWLAGQAGLRTVHPHAVIRRAGTQPIPFSLGTERYLPTHSTSLERPGNPHGDLVIDFYTWPANLPNSRQDYAWKMLRKGPGSAEEPLAPLETDEVPTVLATLRRSYVLRQDWAGLQDAAEAYPDLRSQGLRPRRNLYWYGFYPALENIERILWFRGPFAPALGVNESPPK